ncbi:unnamed protein product (macronuclear) [Paramecium tetraurelia]|uniref:Ubiquitin-like protease family profile domain-containing protein n=1 Tax=Paramecium tetraurelia TaxID=5888 RepID=A0DKW9_PARTE|nr:uncharacterized protein GSPATT00018003001 [Paramecium tetraurelia]CAK83686.1 unnamed protein product [Paramecium tetraurelia]|eukprot:XP_001451083.1 hypothetical protein (macronuclear) [Paramecium tetraurelia strain d4-2]
MNKKESIFIQEIPSQRVKTCEPSQNRYAETQKCKYPSHPIKENKKIKFLDPPGQQGRPELDFQKLISEKLIKYRENIKNPEINYDIQHYDHKKQKLQNQKMNEQEDLQFPKLVSISLNKFPEEFEKSIQSNFDEILESNKLIMKISFDKIEIYDKDGNLKEIKKSFPFSSKHQSKDIMYNAIFRSKDFLILKSTGMWLTSNIVDSYANYLRLADEQKYFTSEVEVRKKHRRTYIFCSDYITNCSINTEFNKEKWLTLFYEQLSNFESIQYQFWKIYQNIIFVVNQNFHWFCAKLDLEESIIEIYDSLYSNPEKYERLILLFQTIFSEVMSTIPIFKIKIIREFPRQSDYNSCGYFSCIALNYLTEKQFNTEQQVEEKQGQKYISKQEMKKILRELLIEDQNS